MSDQPSPKVLWDQAGIEKGTQGVDAIQSRYVELMKQHGYITEKVAATPPANANAETEDTATALRRQIDQLTSDNKKLLAQNVLVTRQIANQGLHELYSREVSTFHRTSLLPLVDTVKQILSFVEKDAPEPVKAKVDELNKYLTQIEQRTKHFDKQAAVAITSAKAIEETKKLEAGTHAVHCSKANDHAKRCDCHLASNYPKP